MRFVMRWPTIVAVRRTSFLARAARAKRRRPAFWPRCSIARLLTRANHVVSARRAWPLNEARVSTCSNSTQQATVESSRALDSLV